VFATLLDPAAEAGGDPEKAEEDEPGMRLNEITAVTARSTGTRGVSILGHRPTGRGERQAKRPGRRSARSAILRLRTVEKEHGADIYSTEMVLTPDGNGLRRHDGGSIHRPTANGGRMVSVFGPRRADLEARRLVFSPRQDRTRDYRLVKNGVNSPVVT